MQPFISLKWKFICLNDWMSIFQCSRLISPHRAKYIKMNCFIVHVFSSEKLDSYWNWKWKLAWENITVSFPKLPFPPSAAKVLWIFFFFHLPALIGFSSLCLSGGAGTAETAGGGGWGAVSDCSAHAQRHHQEDPEERVSFFWLIYSTGFSIFCSDDIVDVNF